MAHRRIRHLPRSPRLAGQAMVAAADPRLARTDRRRARSGRHAPVADDERHDPGRSVGASVRRLVCDAPERAIVDEFTSVVDRQIAKFGALAFAKAWRRLKAKQVVLLTPHYDVVEWLEPDWVFDTAKRSFARGLLRRPQFDLEIWKTDGSLWPLFEPHHYLKLPRMVGAAYYVGTVDGELAVHLAVSSANKGGEAEARACGSALFSPL